ncbi:Pectin lyase-like superfamily protein [Euphorbia peplus]|nr:Pectin lyase-like superfamily protein [Euphorbia peplus]
MVVQRHFALALCMTIFFFFAPQLCHSQNMNAIDRCWRKNPDWRRSRQQLATCSVGFTGKMTNNIGKNVLNYKVTNPTDDPINPKPGTLRYGATMIKGKVWITFQRNMNIKLQKPLLISSFTALDGRGAIVHITGNACLLIYKATDVIIHGLRIHHCKAVGPSSVRGENGKVVALGQMDGDAIRLVSSSKIWIDHNTLYACQDGLLDVTRGSTAVTISNNWFKDQDKVMLLGHDDGYLRDKNMKVTVVFNHFGPNCNQRMPRVRHGYAHVANNLYDGWTQYAIGGSMNPSIKSESNYFIAPKLGKKEITWRNGAVNMPWKFYSVNDAFENGASFAQTGVGMAKPNYTNHQSFQVSDVKSVKALTMSSGALQCYRTIKC